MKRQIGNILALPAFFFGFSMLYNPFGIMDNLEFGGMTSGFHLLMMAAIILLTVLATRGILSIIREDKKNELWFYIRFCLVETFICACFMALYVTIFKHNFEEYFKNLADSMKYSYLSLVYPYIIIALIQYVKAHSSRNEEPSGLMKIKDEHGRLKLTVQQDAVLYIEAEINHIKANYLQGSSIRSTLIRTSMKSQEENAARHGLVRCHRSYFINPKHVKLLTKDKESGLIYAVLDASEPVSVPVSKQYYEYLSNLL